MREYAEEGIRHFYFMMLQKDEVRLSSSCVYLYLFGSGWVYFLVLYSRWTSTAVCVFGLGQ